MNVPEVDEQIPSRLRGELPCDDMSAFCIDEFSPLRRERPQGSGMPIQNQHHQEKTIGCLPSSQGKQCKQKIAKVDPPKKFTWRSGYNIFFRLERERLISEQQERDFTTADIDRIIALQKLEDKKPVQKRKHRKTHGKIGFAELAKVIANKWKRMSPIDKAVYDHRAAFEKEQFMKAREEEIQRRSETPSNNRQVVVASVPEDASTYANQQNSEEPRLRISPIDNAIYNHRSAFEKEQFMKARAEETQRRADTTSSNRQFVVSSVLEDASTYSNQPYSEEPRLRESQDRRIVKRFISQRAALEGDCRSKAALLQQQQQPLSYQTNIPENNHSRGYLSDEGSGYHSHVAVHHPGPNLVTPTSPQRQVLQPTADQQDFLPVVTKDFLDGPSSSLNHRITPAQTDFTDVFSNSTLDCGASGLCPLSSDKPESPDEALEMSLLLASYE